MSSFLSTETRPNFEFHGLDRWAAYRRLQELDIPCQCTGHCPLKVCVNSATAAIQLWSVSQQLTASRQELVQWLQHCASLEV